MLTHFHLKVFHFGQSEKPNNKKIITCFESSEPFYIKKINAACKECAITFLTLWKGHSKSRNKGS